MKVPGVFLVALFFNLAYTQLVKGQPQPREGCKTECGNVKIEYPFGISSGCYYPGNNRFNVTCKKNTPYVLGNIEMKKFNHNGHLQVMLRRYSSCEVEPINGTFFGYGNFGLGYLSLSNKNKFTLVGCNAMGLLTTIGTKNYATSCISLCNSLPAANGTCDGEGCCSTSVQSPWDSSLVETASTNLPFKLTSVHQFNNCTYTFLVEDGQFNFSSSEDLKNLRNVTMFPVELDWSIGNQTCKQVGNTICSENSTCFDSPTRTGYNCKCFEGFEGNPYLSAGCQDINECTSNRHNCSATSTCENTKGSFRCKCKSGYHLDTTDMSCKRKDFTWAMIFIGNTIAFLVFLLFVTCIQQKMKHRKIAELRKQFFEQNGGGMLRQRLSGAGPSNVDVKIFNEDGMKEATNGYDETNILGQGGQGTVYKGILPDTSIVAIKKARLGDSSQVEQFINESLCFHRSTIGTWSKSWAAV